MEKKSFFRNIAATYFMAYFGFNLFRTLIKNYCVDVFKVSATQIGILEGVRELPGLLGAGAGILALVISEVSLVYVSVFLLGAGLIWIGLSGSFFTVVMATLLMSLGFHYFASSVYSVNLHVFARDRLPSILARLRSLDAVSLVVATLIIIPTFTLLGYRGFFVTIGGAVVLAALVLGKRQSRSGTTFERRRITIRRCYWKYYTLTFLAGTRRHIFTTFAIFLLVKTYHTSPETIALLLLINGFVTIWTNRVSGWFIGRFGERNTLSFEYLSLTFIFLTYGLTHSIWVLYGLFLLDQVIFGFSIGVHTYFQKIADPADITGNVAFGQTLNHIAAVAIPIVGGVIWDATGPLWVFTGGALVAFITMGVTLSLPSREQLRGFAAGAFPRPDSEKRS